MPKYRTQAGVIVDRSEDYVRAFAPGVFTPVDETKRVTQMECCGGDEWLIDDEDED